MSLNWSFEHPAGLWTIPAGVPGMDTMRKETTFTLYRGNAYLIVLNETETEYTLVSFWRDKEHMKNCLGLTRGHDNIYQDWEGSHIFLYEDNCPHARQIADAMFRAFENITVTIQKHAPKKERTIVGGDEE